MLAIGYRNTEVDIRKIMSSSFLHVNYAIDQFLNFIKNIGKLRGKQEDSEGFMLLVNNKTHDRFNMLTQK